jgi:hypothetical protein
MTSKNAEGELGDLLSDPLAVHGFRRDRDLVFSRRTHDRVDGIDFATLVDHNGIVRVSLAVTITFEALAPLLSDGQDERPTVAMPAHLLHESEQYQDWVLSGRNKAEIRNELLEEVERYALPFFDRYPDLDALHQALESDEPNDWIIFDTQQRIATLVAIDWVQGRKSGARDRLSSALNDLESTPLKKRYQLSRLKARLSSLD